MEELFCSHCSSQVAQFKDLFSNKVYCLQCYFFKQQANKEDQVTIPKVSSKAGELQSLSQTQSEQSKRSSSTQINQYQCAQQPDNISTQPSIDNLQGIMLGKNESSQNPSKQEYQNDKQYLQQVNKQGNQQDAKGKDPVFSSIQNYFTQNVTNQDEQNDFLKGIDELLANECEENDNGSLQLLDHQMSQYSSELLPKSLSHESLVSYGHEGQRELTRRERVERYIYKKHHKPLFRIPKYEARKRYAQTRPRIRGRFAKKEEIDNYLKQNNLNLEDLQSNMDITNSQFTFQQQLQCRSKPQSEEQWNYIFNCLGSNSVVNDSNLLLAV